MKKTKLIFDVETNGLCPTSSVLSFSALVVDNKNRVIKEYDRYYFPRANEETNHEAIKINGLTKETIKINRSRAETTYPKRFGEDKEILDLFAQKHQLYIAHNIDFDAKFIAYHLDYYIEEEKEFCTMIATQYLYDAPYMRQGKPKYPKLSESTAHFNINTKKFAEKGGYHSSLFDCYCCLEIFKQLMS